MYKFIVFAAIVITLGVISTNYITARAKGHHHGGGTGEAIDPTITLPPNFDQIISASNGKDGVIVGYTDKDGRLFVAQYSGTNYDRLFLYKLNQVGQNARDSKVDFHLTLPQNFDHAFSVHKDKLGLCIGFIAKDGTMNMIQYSGSDYENESLFDFKKASK